MKARQEFRSREGVEVEILDALVDRKDDGMTVLELRSHVDRDIETLESALAHLKEDGLITAEDNGSRTVIRPDDSVVPARPAESEGSSFVDEIKRRLPF